MVKKLIPKKKEYDSDINRINIAQIMFMSDIKIKKPFLPRFNKNFEQINFKLIDETICIFISPDEKKNRLYRLQ